MKVLATWLKLKGIPVRVKLSQLDAGDSHLDLASASLYIVSWDNNDGNV